MKKMIEIKNLKKKYDNQFQLGEINLDIPSGCIVGCKGRGVLGAECQSVRDIIL